MHRPSLCMARCASANEGHAAKICADSTHTVLCRQPWLDQSARVCHPRPARSQGLAYLLTFLFGANAVGLSALGVQLLLSPESADAAQQVHNMTLDHDTTVRAAIP